MTSAPLGAILAVMLDRAFIVKAEGGLGQQAAALFVHEAAKFKSKVLVRRAGIHQTASGSSFAELMQLAARCGDELTLFAVGEDEAAALESLGRIIESGFPFGPAADWEERARLRRG